MRQKQTKVSSDIYVARGRKRKRKRRRSPFRVITVLLCAFIGAFFAYQITIGNKQITLPNNAFVGNQLETLLTNTEVPDFIQQALPSEKTPVNTVAPDFEQIVSTTDEAPAAKQLPSNLNINSANAILMDYENGTILFDKNGEEKMYPASMTKIMTAIVALEHIKDPNEKVTLSEAIFQPIYKANASVAGFLPGENVRVIDLLYGLLLPSGAECAVGLTEYVAGSESEFVSLMNDKAQEIGMIHSNFTNTIGLHDNNHYSTAMDMSVLLRYALENDTFFEIISSSKHSTPSTNRHEVGITYYSTLFSKIGSPKFEGGSILGGKTGFTEEAGQCLASFAAADSNKYILVTSGAFGNYQTQELHIDDAFTIYTAINNDRDIQISDNTEKSVSADAPNYKEERINLRRDAPGRLPLHENNAP